MLLVIPSCGYKTGYSIPIARPTASDVQLCDNPFVQGTYRFVHSVEGTLSDNHHLSVIGITVLSSESRSIHCVIMTIEGFVLFDAVYDQKLTINRSIPPFDSEHFAHGMLEDIRFIFFKPTGPILATGWSANGEYICRYNNMDRQLMTDVIIREYEWEILEYAPYAGLKRSVKAVIDHKHNIPRQLELRAYSQKPYVLKLYLIQHEAI